MGGQAPRTNNDAARAVGHMSTLASWLGMFLQARKLSTPDGRPLYAYRCNAEEFRTLAGALQLQSSSGPQSARAFVLYASEWWRREYDGRRWAWEPLLQSVGWQVHYPDLYESVRDAWAWWDVQPVRLPSSTRFLGTFACHGGLPLALVGDSQNSVTRYLRAVLTHVQEYRRFVDDTIDLAADKDYLLRPPTLRRDYVFRLAADLAEAVLDLQPSIQDGNPIATLDEVRPDWRRAMPLVLDNEVARNLLTLLFRDASTGAAAPASEFRVRRFLRRTGAGWRLGASVRLPASIGVDDLAKHLGMDASGLGPRIEVRVDSGGEHVAGVYGHAHQSDADEYRLAGRRASLVLWDEGAAAEIRLRFVAGDYIGSGIVPTGGAMLGELPWAFRADEHECPFIGEDTVSSRAPELVALVPTGVAEPPPDVAVEAGVLGRAMWRIKTATTIRTDNGPCTMRPASSEQPDQEYRLGGERWYQMVSKFPLYRGVPSLRAGAPDGLPKKLPPKEVSWRQTGGDWLPQPNGPGLWQVRHIVNEELRFHGRVGILPNGFMAQPKLGDSAVQGSLIFTGAENVRVTTEAPVGQEVDHTTHGICVAFTAHDKSDPPTTLSLRLHWPNTTTALPVETPFPARGGRFLRQGEVADEELAVGELYGVKAIAYAPPPAKFSLAGDLKANDLGVLTKVAHFRRPLRQEGACHVLSLVDVRPLVEFLLSTSSDLDARVRLQIVGAAGTRKAALDVFRFAKRLEYDPRDSFITLSPENTGDETPFEALSIARPEDDPVPLAMTGPSAISLPDALRNDEPWLVVARNHGVGVRPVAISFAPELHRPVQADVSLRGASRLPVETDRRRSIGDAFDRLTNDEDESNEHADDWEFLTNMLLRADGVPIAAIDVLTELTGHPRLLVRCMFRLESAPRQLLWGVEDELPFSWLLIKRHIWWEEAKRSFQQNHQLLEKVLDDSDEAAQRAGQHVQSVLEEGVARNGGLRSIATDLRVRLNSGYLSQSHADAKKALEDESAPEQIKTRNDLDDWPQGDGRQQWAGELGKSWDGAEILAELWDPRAGLWRWPTLGHQQPIFDTPVAAALFSILPSLEPSRRAVFMVKRMRTYDPDWFDVVYARVWTQLAVMQKIEGRAEK